MVINQKEIYYSFYKNKGWKITKNKKIKGSDLTFDILGRDREKKLLYFMNKRDNLKDFIKIARSITILSPKSGFIFATPHNFKSSSLIDLRKICEEGAEIITIEDRIVTVILTPDMIKKQEHEIVTRLRKELSDINTISAAKPRIDFSLFNMSGNEKIFKLIKPTIKEDSEYRDQILAINLILDMINKREIVNNLNPPKQEIEKGQINLLRWTFQKLGMSINQEIFIFFGYLRKLRAEFPTHLKNEKELAELEKIKKVLTSSKKPNCKILWVSIINKFLDCLDLIKKDIKNIK